MINSTPTNSEDAGRGNAVEMIKFLLGFCRSGDGKTVPVHDEQVVKRAFKETRRLANHGGALQARLQEL